MEWPGQQWQVDRDLAIRDGGGIGIAAQRLSDDMGAGDDVLQRDQYPTADGLVRIVGTADTGLRAVRVAHAVRPLFKLWFDQEASPLSSYFSM
jgi:hypothetical protein